MSYKVRTFDDMCACHTIIKIIYEQKYELQNKKYIITLKKNKVSIENLKNNTSC